MSDTPAPPGNILLVDDTPANLRLLSAMLTHQGYKVRSVINGLMALTAVRAAHPDLILLDINMPGMTGYDVCQELQADATTSHLPVIFISALDETMDKVKAFAAGGVDYITKPFQVEEVLARVGTQLTLFRQRQELVKRYEEIQQLQKQLVEQEKMAALGALVAGISHEINTPVGIGVTAASLLDQKTRDFALLFANNQMKRSDLENYLQMAQESSAILLGNLNRAAELIHSFKQIAVDQASEARRPFKVKEYLGEVLLHLSPELKRANHQVDIEGDDVTLDSYPGAFAQLVTNLVMNSLVHAYEAGESGRMLFMIQAANGRAANGRVTLRYSDNGRGIAPEHLDHIFEPFFTTRRGQGGSGLGLHIVYNLATRQFNGTIRCESIVGLGTAFVIEIPVEKEY
jgi:signal transduction histidine kinase